ncbi:MAG: glutathione S-transferase [Lasallia pustulata]|uniref:Glutathione S-transferase n=1 Tax=Lasallia pustulata TaxID=136370 RepID=A0A5M8PNX4_9LECA|nr:MAG: glutathione S-transferase [Lasallia pustulata]
MAVVLDEKVPDIKLYTAQTPNGIKISITLEELGIPYTVHKIDMSKNAQKEPWFLAINPNGRIPALTDTFSDGQPIHLFESGSIMQYLIEQYDTTHKISYPKGTRESYQVNNWLFFLNAGLGPMQGQANHFHRYAPEKIEYGVQRYQNETRRLYGVLDKHLAASSSGYLVGSKCTIADIAHWEWEERMMARPAVERGRHVPDPHRIKEMLKDREATERHAAESRKWVQQGMKEDAKK